MNCFWGPGSLKRTTNSRSLRESWSVWVTPPSAFRRSNKDATGWRPSLLGWRPLLHISTSNKKLLGRSRNKGCFSSVFLQAKKVEPVPLSNGLRSMVAGPSAPQYSPCTSYGEFSGDGEYYQVCRESPLVKKVQQQTFRPWVANREELPAFALRCLSARTVLTNISWPTSIPAPGYGGRIIGEVNATCAVLGSRNAVSSMRQERFPVKYNASSHFVNFSCPPDMVLDLVQFVVALPTLCQVARTRSLVDCTFFSSFAGVCSTLLKKTFTVRWD